MPQTIFHQQDNSPQIPLQAGHVTPHNLRCIEFLPLTEAVRIYNYSYFINNRFVNDRQKGDAYTCKFKAHICIHIIGQIRAQILFTLLQRISFLNSVWNKRLN